MADYLSDIIEGQPLDSIQDVYLTHTTIMKNIIDSNTYDKMMVRVSKDIMGNDEILNKIKGLKRKQRLFLGEIIFLWAKQNWSNHFQTNRQYRRAYASKFNPPLSGVQSRNTGPTPWEVFNENFKEAFSDDVHWECEYKLHAKNYEIRTTSTKNNEYNVLMNHNDSWSRRDVEARLIAKYNDKKHTLKICYIEYTGGRWSIKFTPKVLRPELFKGVKKIMNQIAEDKGSKPELVCAKKCIKIYEEAKRRKYLEDHKQDDDFVI